MPHSQTTPPSTITESLNNIQAAAFATSEFLRILKEFTPVGEFSSNEISLQSFNEGLQAWGMLKQKSQARWNRASLLLDPTVVDPNELKELVAVMWVSFMAPVLQRTDDSTISPEDMKQASTNMVRLLHDMFSALHEAKARKLFDEFDMTDDARWNLFLNRAAGSLSALNGETPSFSGVLSYTSDLAIISDLSGIKDSFEFKSSVLNLIKNRLLFLNEDDKLGEKATEEITDLVRLIDEELVGAEVFPKFAFEPEETSVSSKSIGDSDDLFNYEFTGAIKS